MKKTTKTPLFTQGQIAWVLILFWILISSLEHQETQPDPVRYWPVETNTIDSMPFDVVPFGQNTIPKPVSLSRYVSAKYSSEHVYALRNLNLGAMREYLEGIGFKDLEGMNLNHLRHMYAAWVYDDLIGAVAERSCLPKGVVFSFFVYEAMNQGIETDLFRLHWNPGGVKSNGRSQSVKFKDDCGAFPCDFRKAAGFDSAVELWSNTFNSARYLACKTGKSEDIVRKLIQAGYSTDQNWQGRASLCAKYEIYRKKFKNNWGKA